MSDEPEIRPMVVVNRADENELTAAIWRDDRNVWQANDGREFNGKGPELADDLLVVMEEPQPLVGRVDRGQADDSWETLEE